LTGPTGCNLVKSEGPKVDFDRPRSSGPPVIGVLNLLRFLYNCTPYYCLLNFFTVNVAYAVAGLFIERSHKKQINIPCYKSL